MPITTRVSDLTGELVTDCVRGGETRIVDVVSAGGLCPECQRAEETSGSPGPDAERWPGWRPPWRRTAGGCGRCRWNTSGPQLHPALSAVDLPLPAYCSLRGFLKVVAGAGDSGRFERVQVICWLLSWPPLSNL